jgi:hypothetical protein
MADAMGQSDVQLHLLAPMSFLLPHFRTFVAPHLVVDVSTAVVLDGNFGKPSNSTNVAQ